MTALDGSFKGRSNTIDSDERHKSSQPTERVCAQASALNRLASRRGLAEVSFGYIGTLRVTIGRDTIQRLDASVSRNTQSLVLRMIWKLGIAKEPSEVWRASRAWCATSRLHVVSFAILEFETAINLVRHIPCNNIYRLNTKKPRFQERLRLTRQRCPQAWLLEERCS